MVLNSAINYNIFCVVKFGIPHIHGLCMVWCGMAQGYKLTPGLWDKTVIGGKIIHAPHVTLY